MLTKQLQAARSAAAKANSKKGAGGGAGNAVKAIQTKLEKAGEFTNVRDFNMTWKKADKEFLSLIHIFLLRKIFKKIFLNVISFCTYIID